MGNIPQPEKGAAKKESPKEETKSHQSKETQRGDDVTSSSFELLDSEQTMGFTGSPTEPQTTRIESLPTGTQAMDEHVEPPACSRSYCIENNGLSYLWRGWGPGQEATTIRIFNAKTKTWILQPTNGPIPLGQYSGGCAVLGNNLFCFGGHSELFHYNGLYKLNLNTFQWSKLFPQNDPSEWPYHKMDCGFIVVNERTLGCFGGYGVRRESHIQPVSTSASSTGFTDGHGWTNEFHLFDLEQGVWTSPLLKGERPPPCAGFTLTKVDSERAVLFGGHQYRHGRVNHLYLFNLRSMKVTKLEPMPGIKHPVGRVYHAACCLNYGLKHPKLLISGGVDEQKRILDDSWMLDVNTVQWTEVTFPQLVKRQGHSMTASRIAPGLIKVLVFGGSRVFPPKRIDTIADTVTFEFGLRILSHPENAVSKLRDESKFTIQTSQTAKSYQWKWNAKDISREDSDFMGTTTDCLSIVKCLPKHRGSYQCVVVTELDTILVSETATLKIDGDPLEEAEAELLGDILKAANIDLGEFGVDIQELLEGRTQLTYQELEFVLNDNPTTKFLSVNLKQKLQSKLQDEQIYQSAIAKGRRVSLTYIKILALGPGQVGKSTFLYRLLDLMDGNIEESSKEQQPQSSTGQSDLREVCIKYENALVSASTDLTWELCELQTQIEGLMWLLSNQTQDEDTHSTHSVVPSLEMPQADNYVTLFSSESSSSGSDQNLVDSKTDNTLRFEMSKDNMPNQLENPINTTAGQNVKSAQSVVSSTLSIVPKDQSYLVDEIVNEYEVLRTKCRLSSGETNIHMLFNIGDVGGQPAFLDMLPSLTIGPAFYLLFTKLINDLGEVLGMDDLARAQPVQYRTKHDISPLDCKNYTYTLEEVLFSTLSSIACFGLSDKEVEKYVTKIGDTQKNSSLAVLFGTFADKLDEDGTKKLHETESALKLLLKGTEFCESGLICFPNPAHRDYQDSHVFLKVNNKTGSREEIVRYRKIIQELVEKNFRKYDIPASWLGMSICLKILASKKETYKVSFDDCVKLGRHFNMAEKEVKAALKFLHKYIGLLMFFPDDIYLQNFVICDPQVVFSSVSELTFSIYDSSSRQEKPTADSSKQKRFEETGIFSPLEVSYPKESTKFMSINDLVHLLVNLNIAAKITTFSDSYIPDIDELYFLPAVLKTADSSSLALSTENNDEILPEPLCVRFETGYMPMGFTCALSARLMADDKFCLAPGEQTCYKNKIRFRYNGQFNVTMVSFPLHCEFHVAPHYGNRSFHNCCPEVMKIICEAINFVVNSMQQSMVSNVCFSLAFKCPNHHNTLLGHEPLATFFYSYGSQTVPKRIECTKCVSVITDLEPEKKVWFGESLNIPPNITNQPALKKNRILIEAEGTQPLRYQWLKNDEVVSDGDDYKGSTTPELIIAGTSPQVKGNYSCVVKHKYGKVMSKEISFHPFAAELMSKGISHKLISKLIAHEIESLEDLQHLQDSGVCKEIGLTLIEKAKLKKVFSSEYLHIPALDITNSANEYSVNDNREDAETKNRTDSKKTFCSKIQQYDLPFLASHFDNVEYYLDVFELSPAEQTDVRSVIPQGTQIAVTKCLSIWRAHSPESATFRSLVDILEKLRKETIAFQVMKYVTDSS